MSLTAKTVNYALTHMPKLARYVNNGRFRPGNNNIEKVIRPLKVGLNKYGTATITTPQLKGIAPNDFANIIGLRQNFAELHRTWQTTPNCAKLHWKPARAGSVNLIKKSE